MAGFVLYVLHTHPQVIVRFLDCSEKPDPKRAPLVPLPMPKKLYFHIDREIKRDIEHAKQNLDM